MTDIIKSRTTVDESRLLTDPKTGKVRQPIAHPGYYPGFSTLEQQAFWDETTRRVVLDRVEKAAPIRFFSPEQARLMSAVFDHLLPQQDRDEAHQIPILNFVDARLYENHIDGYRFENMPPDREAYKLGIQGIEQLAQAMYKKLFVDLEPVMQDEVLKSIHDGNPIAAAEIWARMPTHMFWMLMLQDAVEAYYSHPLAWDEIGFGGPSYPRAYMRLEHGSREPWEVNEARYEWRAPAASVSDHFEKIGDQLEHGGNPGQRGSH